MEKKLIIPIEGATTKDVEDTPLTGFISWQRLANTFRDVREISRDEKLIGFEVTEKGITFKVQLNPTPDGK